MSTDGSDPTVVYGLLTLAGMDVALPLSALREVVSCPERLDVLPADAPGLLGAMNLRALVLPVLDLRPILGRPQERQSDQVVVVVAHDDRLLGVLVDDVRGVAQLPRSALQAIRADGEGLVFSHAFVDPGTGRTVSVLDAGTLLRRPGVPTVADVGRTGSAISEAAGSARPQGEHHGTVVVLACGEHRLALDVAAVHTTVPSSAARASVLDGELCRGVLDFAGSEVPVVDLLGVLGLGALPVGDTGAGVVLDLGTGYVVLAVSELLDLVEVAADDVLPLPAVALPHPELVAGLLDTAAHGQVMVLDGDRLAAHPVLMALGVVNTASSSSRTDPTEGPAAATGGQPHLVFSAGGDLCAPLAQVEEILPFPPSWLDTGVGGATMGVVVHRSTAVPVLDLPALLGRADAEAASTSCLLLVAVAGGQVAFAVDALGSIEPLCWTDPDQPAGRDPDRVLDRSPLVQLGDQPRLLPALDLVELATRCAVDPRSDQEAVGGRPGRQVLDLQRAGSDPGQ